MAFLRSKLILALLVLIAVGVASCAKTGMQKGPDGENGPGGHHAGNGNGEPILGALKYLSAYTAPVAPGQAELFKLGSPAPTCGGQLTYLEKITGSPLQRFSNACNGNAGLSFDSQKLLTLSSPFALYLDGTGSIFSRLLGSVSFNRPAPVAFAWNPAAPELAIVVSAYGSSYQIITYFAYQGGYYTTRPAEVKIIDLNGSLLIVGHTAQAQFNVRLNQHYGSYVNDPIYQAMGTAYVKIEEAGPGTGTGNSMPLSLPSTFPFNISDDLNY